jgi:HSP20 family molecular chaperone IbpA
MIYTTKYPSRQRRIMYPPVGNLIKELMNIPSEEPKKEERTKYTYPATNVVKYDNRYEILLAIPGLSKSDLSIEVDNDFISISANIEEKELKYNLREFNYGKFNRKFQVPEDVDTDAIEATVKDGILNLVLPLIPEAEPIKIKIK